MKTLAALLLLSLPVAAQVIPGPRPVKASPVIVPPYIPVKPIFRDTGTESVRETDAAWLVTHGGVERSVPKTFSRETAVAACRSTAARAAGPGDVQLPTCQTPGLAPHICGCGLNPQGACLCEGTAACGSPNCTPKAVPVTPPTAKATAPVQRYRTEYRTVTRYVQQCNGNGTCRLVPQTVTEAVQVPVE